MIGPRTLEFSAAVLHGSGVAGMSDEALADLIKTCRLWEAVGAFVGGGAADRRRRRATRILEHVALPELDRRRGLWNVAERDGAEHSMIIDR